MVLGAFLFYIFHVIPSVSDLAVFMKILKVSSTELDISVHISLTTIEKSPLNTELFTTHQRGHKIQGN